ncbi:MAG: PilN domain-containing protein [Methylococcaceae bacterium]
MVKLDSNINIDIPAFFRWWGSELAFLVPEKIKDFFVYTKGQLILRPSKESLTIIIRENGEEELIGPLELNKYGREFFKNQLNKRAELRESETILSLPDSYAAQKKVFLPIVAADNLKQVITYELDKFTPFTPEQVYFDTQRLDGKGSQEQLEALIVFSPKEKLDVLFEELKSWQLTPQIVEYEKVPSYKDGRYSYNLLPSWARKKKDKLPKVFEMVLLVLFLTFLSAMLIMPVWREYSAVKTLEGAVQNAGVAAEKVESVKTEISSYYDEAQSLIDRKNLTPSLVEIMEKLNNILPDNSWLTHLRYYNKTLQVNGLSPGASSLIGALEAVPIFSNTRFVSPVTQDRRTGLERFLISLDVAMEKDGTNSK